MFSDLTLSLCHGPQAWVSLVGWPPTPRQFHTFLFSSDFPHPILHPRSQQMTSPVFHGANRSHGLERGRPTAPSPPVSAPPWPPPLLSRRGRLPLAPHAIILPLMPGSLSPSQASSISPSSGAVPVSIHACSGSVLSACSLYLQPLMLVSHFSGFLTVNFLKKWSPHPYTAPGPASHSSSNPPGSWLRITAELAQVRAPRSCHAACPRPRLSDAQALLLETLLHQPPDATARFLLPH